MRVIYSEDHKLRDAKTELHGGLLVKPFEGPFRAEWILAAVREAGFSDVAAPDRHGLETALKVHDAGYLDFLSKAWRLWKASGAEGEAIPTSLPVRRATQRVPRDIDGMLGYYANATETSITDGTYEAAVASMQCAVTGADWLNAGNRFAWIWLVGVVLCFSAISGKNPYYLLPDSPRSRCCWRWRPMRGRGWGSRPH